METVHYWWSARLMWAVVMAFNSLFFAAPLFLLGFLLDATGAALTSIVLTAGLIAVVAVYRGASCSVVTDPDGVRVRNAWRTHLVPWADVLSFTMAQPGAMKGASTLALRTVGHRRPLPVCALTALGRRQETELPEKAHELRQAHKVAMEPALTELSHAART